MLPVDSRRVVRAVALLVCVHATRLAWGAEDLSAPPRLTPSGLSVVVERRAFVPTLELSGRLVSTKSRDVISSYRQYTGISWLAAEGAFVNEGDLVATVDNYGFGLGTQHEVWRVPRNRADEAALRAETDLEAADRRRKTLRAKWRLDQAEHRLETLAQGPDPSDVALAELSVQAARVELDAARKRLARQRGLVESGTVATGEELAICEHGVSLAKLKLDRAEQGLRILTAGAGELDLLAAHAAIAGKATDPLDLVAHADRTGHPAGDGGQPQPPAHQ